ncbi:MAG: hypothetical protein ACLGI6_20040 [Gammaproteobacteria bacterium]
MRATLAAGGVVRHAVDGLQLGEVVGAPDGAERLQVRLIQPGRAHQRADLLALPRQGSVVTLQQCPLLVIDARVEVAKLAVQLAEFGLGDGNIGLP